MFKHTLFSTLVLFDMGSVTVHKPYSIGPRIEQDMVLKYL